ncbi:unnamed protein product (macronuclear) [Paramecium tetraurelia]|uniref:Uncharacterized protein n=1 Tax=Paramecium tetraurelia TaxID=5888 RepID=A0DWH1_PARTE|nr:uncharacterized protein GSPATT00021030001 [Paramecium tetraurelia]CAK87388.1 unnamed protein product [Paramecium tetraurelia]|eukprot:XP_001454785.1 hypothetical protein (macronuclear) [Paramecium tetraurelia strain d4-2]
MSSIPSMNLFSGPQIQKTRSIYRPFGTHESNYYSQPPKQFYPEKYSSIPSYHEYLANQGRPDYNQSYPEYIDKEHYVPIKHESPFQTLYKYDKTNPTPKDAFITPYRPKVPTDEEIQEHIPIIDLVIEQQRFYSHFSDHGLPKGYAEKDYQRELEDRYNRDLTQQINNGFKLQETRTKKEIDDFYRNIKVAVDERGRVQINNIRQPQQVQKGVSTIYKTTEDTAKVASNLQPFDNNSYQQPNKQQEQQQYINHFQGSFHPYQQPTQQQQQQQQPIHTEEKAPSEKNSIVIPIPGDSNLQQSQLEQSKVITSND